MIRRIVGLDIGACFIRTVIAEIDSDENIEIIGVSKVPSQGVRNGVIVNIDLARDAVRESIEAAEQAAGIDVEDVYISIGGPQVDSLSSRGLVCCDPRGSSRRVEITSEAKRRALESAQSISIPFSETLIHIVPQEYIVDGIEIPDHTKLIGTGGVRLEVKALLVKVSSTAFGNIKECIMRAGYLLRAVTLKTLAAAYSTIHSDEMDLGSVLIDLGGGATDVIVFHKGAPIYTTSIPAGGNRITNDVATVLGIPFAAAEKLKIEQGACWLDEDQEKEEVIVPGVGGLPPAQIERKFLCEIIYARMEEIMRSCAREVARHSGLERLDGTIVLTGGGALMPGVDVLTQEVWKTSSVRIGCSANFGGVDDSYRNADYATAIGLVLANKNDNLQDSNSKRMAKKHKGEAKTSAFKSFIKKFI